MREYGRLAPTFWTRGTGKELRGCQEAQIVATYLMSAPTSNMIGLYYIPLATIALETGLPLQGARKGLQRLIEVGFCQYDFAEDFVFVTTMARRQLGLEEGEALKHSDPDPRKWDKRCHGAAKLMHECAIPALLQSFWDVYRDVLGLPEPWWKQAHKPLASPKEDPPKPGSGSGSGSGKEQAQDPTGGSSAPTEPASERPGLTLLPDEPPEESPHAVVVACWFEEFEKVRGVKPAFQGKRDGEHVRRLLATFGGSAEKVCALIRSACADADWMRRRATLADLDSNPNQFLGKTPKGTNAGRPTLALQPGVAGRQWAQTDPEELAKVTS